MTGMNTGIVAKVTADGKLEIPPEVLAQLQPFTEYEVSVSEDEIVFKKTYKRLTLKELRQRVKEAGSDQNQPTLEEISQIVKEVRQELWADK
jgi:arginine utilization protein RocB